MLKNSPDLVQLETGKLGSQSLPFIQLHTQKHPDDCPQLSLGGEILEAADPTPVRDKMGGAHSQIPTVLRVLFSETFQHR